MAAIFYNWTISKLKSELSRRGAKTSGRKADLIERLESYDRNKNFENDPIIMPPVQIARWPDSGFRQLLIAHMNDVPKITMNQIVSYFKYRLAHDSECAADIKAVEKGQALIDSRKIYACSFQDNRESVFFTGIVGAAMKKKVSYSYRLKVKATTGDIVNTDCECPSGKGPHATCKHLAAVLLMLKKFTEDGDLLVGKSCTETLQTFHKPKLNYHGSPVKAQNIPRKRKRTLTLEDPRPSKYRKMSGYQDHVRNVVLNYCGNFSKDLTIRYLYKKADIQEAAKDHAYLKLPFTQHWVDRANMVNEVEADKIQQNTIRQSSSTIWHDERSWRITASRFGEISKCTDRRNRTKLAKSMLTPHQLNTPAILHGKQYEGKAIQLFEEIMNIKVTPCGLFVCVEHPFLGATPDGLVGNDALIEVKCPYTGRNCRITPGKSFKCLESCADKIILKRSHSYFDQIQGQLHISNRKHCFFVVYTFQDILIEKIDYDRSYCEMSLIPKLKLFYEKYYREYIANSL